MKFFHAVDKALARLEGWFIVLFLGLMISLSFVQVVLRAINGQIHVEWIAALMGHLGWTEPFVRLLVLWITFLGASLITGENKHIKIDLMPALLPARWMPLREILISGACMVICALMLKSSIDYIRLEIVYSGPMFLNIPTWIGELILPAGFTLLLFRFFLRALDQGWTLCRGRIP